MEKILLFKNLKFRDINIGRLFKGVAVANGYLTEDYDATNSKDKNNRDKKVKKR